MNAGTPKKSLVEQILDKTFDKLDSLESFHPDNVRQLRRLAQNGNLTKSGQIINALKIDLGEQDETS